MTDPIWFELVGLFLTLIVLLYMIFGDNALFRIVSYTFVGIASGYVAILVIFQVLMPRLFNLLRAGSIGMMALGVVPFLLGALLLFKLSPRLSAIGVLPMAALTGVGAAVAVGGAIFGTLFGQITGTISLFNLSTAPAGESLAQLIEALFILVGTVSTLAYFQFGARSRPAVSGETSAEANLTARRSPVMDLLVNIGKIFIGITLGAMFAGVYTAAISALIERIGFVMEVITNVMAKFF